MVNGADIGPKPGIFEKYSNAIFCFILYIQSHFLDNSRTVTVG